MRIHQYVMPTRLAIKSPGIFYSHVFCSYGGPFRSQTTFRQLSSFARRQHEIVRIPIGLDGAVNLQCAPYST